MMQESAVPGNEERRPGSGGGVELNNLKVDI
jgi:hypothetical protein